MSAWRRAAIERLPNLRETVERADTPGMLWVELWSAFLEAHRDPVDQDLIAGVYSLARWMLEHEELATTVLCGFYEHLPCEPIVRERVAHHLSAAEFRGLEESLRYFLTPEQFSAFKAEFLAERTRVERAARRAARRGE